MSHSILFYSDFLKNFESDPQFQKIDSQFKLNKTLSWIEKKFFSDFDESYLLQHEDTKDSLRKNPRKIHQIEVQESLKKKLKLYDLMLSIHLFDKENQFLSTEKEKLSEFIRSMIKGTTRPPKEDSFEELYNRVKTFSKAHKAKKKDTFFEEEKPFLKKLDQKLDKAASLRERLVPLKNKTLNLVFPLYKVSEYHGIPFTRFSKPLGFLKGCSKKDRDKHIRLGTSHLEALIYQISIILGWESYFAPTTFVKITCKNESFLGSVQKRIPYGTLDDIIGVPYLSERINELEFAKAFAISIFLGFNDAHGDNIFLSRTHTGFIFFDNARSLPHSNGIILKKDEIYLSFRCHLLLIPLALIKLSSETIDVLDKMCNQILKNLENIKNEIKSAKKNFTFPPDWLNEDQIIIAMKERADSFKKALEKSETAYDLIFNTDPTFLFMSSLSILLHIASKGEPLPIRETFKEEQDYFKAILPHLDALFGPPLDIYQTVENARSLQIDFSRVKKITENFHNFKSLIDNLNAYGLEILEKPLEEEEPSQLFLAYELYKNDLLAMAEKDEKDPVKPLEEIK